MYDKQQCAYLNLQGEALIALIILSHLIFTLYVLSVTEGQVTEMRFMQSVLRQSVLLVMLWYCLSLSLPVHDKSELRIPLLLIVLQLEPSFVVMRIYIE